MGTAMVATMPATARRVNDTEWDRIANGYDWSCGMRPLDEWRAIFWAIICPRQIAAMYLRDIDRKPTPAVEPHKATEQDREHWTEAYQALININRAGWPKTGKQTGSVVGHTDLITALAAIPVTKTAADIFEERQRARKEKQKRFVELLEDIADALTNQAERRDEHNIAHLIDGCRVRWGDKAAHLECDELLAGVIVQSKNRAGELVTTINPMQIARWLKKRERAIKRPFASKTSRPVGNTLPSGATTMVMEKAG
jgi:hypothetical protein